jgi:hypothetical protein
MPPGAESLAAAFLIIGFSLIVGAAYLRSAASRTVQASEIPSAPTPESPVSTGAEDLVPYELTKLDSYILRSLGNVKSEDDLARATNVDVDVIRRKLALLTRNGYITENRELTEKGYLVVNEEMKETPTVHREKEIVTREVVRIPCRHCGSLVDQTASKCPSCGAPMSR